jgi:hypothetical protein
MTILQPNLIVQKIHVYPMSIHARKSISSQLVTARFVHRFLGILERFRRGSSGTLTFHLRKGGRGIGFSFEPGRNRQLVEECQAFA